MQAYLCRARVQKSTLRSKQSHVVPSHITYENVISDYCRAHELKTNATAIVEAVIVAIDNGEDS